MRRSTGVAAFVQSKLGESVLNTGCPITEKELPTIDIG
jgi:hypothetical protein